MTDDTTTTRIETGCYVDGHWGIYAIERLHDLAAGMIDGYYDTAKGRDDETIILHHLHGDESATVTLSTGETLTREDATDAVLTQGGLYDELTEMLPTNDDDPFYWFWMDGELFYGFDDGNDSFTISDDGTTVTDEDGRKWEL